MTWQAVIRRGLWGVMAGIGLCGGLFGDSVPVPVAAQDAVQLEATGAPADALDPENGTTAQRRRAYAGLLALLGIVVAGAGVAGLIILWAGRLRRANRAPLPGADLKDELWFLRPPRNEGDVSRSPADDDTVT